MDLASTGFEIIDSGLTAGDVRRVRDAVAPLLAAHPGRGGVRDAPAQVPDLLPVIRGPLKALAQSRLGLGSVAVRVLLFDKTPTANWKVAWHQDVAVAVRAKREVPGWGPWSLKQGVWHVRAPSAVLAEMLTLRLHLDPCGSDNGPVRVLSGTHKLGRLSDSAIEPIVAAGHPVDCLVPAGSILVMRPLLLHSSSPARLPAHRRVLHVEFAPGPLSDGLEWAEQDGNRWVSHAA